MEHTLKKTKLEKIKSPNFSEIEKNIVINYIRENSFIMESKSGKLSVLKKKQEGWVKLSQILKANGNIRDAKSIREFYGRLKNQAKKKISSFKKNMKGTGGGPPPSPPTEMDYLLQDIAPIDFTPDISHFDSDALITDPISFKLTADNLSDGSEIHENQSEQRVISQDKNAPQETLRKLKRKRIRDLSTYEAELLKLNKIEHEIRVKQKQEIFEEELAMIKQKNEQSKQLMILKIEKENLEIKKLKLECNFLENTI